MKRFLSLISFAIIIFVACLLLLNHKLQLNPNTTKSELVQSPSKKIKINDIKTATIKSNSLVPNPTQTGSFPTKILNANTESIEEWKAAITNLHYDAAIKGNWTMWQTNQGFPIFIGGTNQVKFDSELINIYSRGNNSGNIRRVELHSIWMNIADIRSLGDSLLQMMNKDKTSFDTWCDKVGNNWVDAPLYNSYNARLPNSNKYYAFGTHRTFNSEKPWYILFVITDP